MASIGIWLVSGTSLGLCSQHLVRRNQVSVSWSERQNVQNLSDQPSSYVACAEAIEVPEGPGGPGGAGGKRNHETKVVTRQQSHFQCGADMVKPQLLLLCIPFSWFTWTIHASLTHLLSVDQTVWLLPHPLGNLSVAGLWLGSPFKS